ncbi:hypothetical protein K437DRAFT_255703 [Tilletiaria anomala UBC 951]|uniref:Uncharacterized protein n=1 Tax=Tilletiaria anomala (strain ATCC 24038 / CBS 436.72 / UBC 951) TaxID=1037660 RepID=A0A066W1Z0_TILAU|nr:uncharacterized protein K437DRAFT_255703 [Tilletiaria anomala UBC 951]KDN47972.1 hypothetical protein K437DRAFT_255703 [Tilletiaria anomala UBC 951]
MEQRVLLLYQPVFHPHLAIEPSSSGAPMPPSTPESQGGHTYAQKRSNGKSPITLAQGSPAPPLSELPPQVGSVVLDAKHSRSVSALQDAGKSVAQHLDQQTSDSATSSIQVDLFSILPASYTRSTHPAFKHTASMSRSTSSAAYRTTSGSSNDSSGDSGTASGRHCNSPSHHHGHQQQQQQHHGLFSGLASLLHSRPGSRHNSPGSSRAVSRRNSQHSIHSHGSALGSHVLQSHAHDALLELTDVLRVEDEEAEEAREQLLDRLTILSGELEDGGEKRSINIAVRQAGDGESLQEALQCLLRQSRYDELIMVNDADLAHLPHPPSTPPPLASSPSSNSPDMAQAPSLISHTHPQPFTSSLRKRVAGFARLHLHLKHDVHRSRELELEHDRVALAADAHALRKDIQRGFGSHIPILAI